MPGNFLARSGRRCCFSADTPVLMADGNTMPVAEVEPGDEVLATDPESGETTVQKVEGVWVHQDTLYELQVLANLHAPSSLDKDDGAIFATVTTTADHPFWNHTEQQWQPAATLDSGDQLLAHDGEVTTTLGILDYTAHHDITYNLTLNAPHNYYVSSGDSFILVHNTGVAALHALRSTDMALQVIYGHSGEVPPDGQDLTAFANRLQCGLSWQIHKLVR